MSRNKKARTNQSKSFSYILKDTFSTSFDTSTSDNNRGKHCDKQSFTASIPTVDNQNIVWESVFFCLPKDSFQNYLNQIPNQYRQFKLRKRKGGFRTISAPNESCNLSNV